LEDAGGGASAPLAGEAGFLGPEEEVLQGEVVNLLVFSRTGGTKGFGRPACSEPAPVLLALESSISGGEEKSSSTR
jgi:hypothetical protein